MGVITGGDMDTTPKREKQMENNPIFRSNGCREVPFGILAMTLKRIYPELRRGVNSPSEFSGYGYYSKKAGKDGKV